MIPVEHVMILSVIIFLLGLICILVRRNLIFILLGLEIMLNGAGLAFVSAGSKWAQPDGQVMFLFVLAVAAAEVSIGLALILQIFYKFQSLDVNSMNNLKG